jgi:hypothetical protein
MPPEASCPDAVVADFERWDTHGRPGPARRAGRAAEAGIDLEAGRRFWAFDRPDDTTAPR